MNEQLEFLIKLRDAGQIIADATNEYLESLVPTKVQGNNKAAVQETTFNILKYETQQGAKLGEFEVAHKANNIEDKWSHAYNVLRNSNATINSRYHGRDYTYSYWLYGENRIYRQKLKPKG